MANREVDRISRKDDFGSYVARGEPVIIVDEVIHWKAFEKWTLDYLRSAFAHREFSMLNRQRTSFDAFADRLEKGEKNVWAPQLTITGRKTGRVDLTAHELRDDVEQPTLFDKEVLDEINVWIGQGATPLHLDGYDNLLAVIRGVKDILLLEPHWFEDVYMNKFQWSGVDIKNRDLKAFPRLANVPPPIHLLLKEGEMLYLPAHWLHQVDVPQGYAITLNYWYRCQQGVTASGYGRYFYDSLRHMLRCFGDLNTIEKQDSIRRLRAVVDQLNEGRSPGSEKHTTWSGGEDIFAAFRI